MRSARFGLGIALALGLATPATPAPPAAAGPGRAPTTLYHKNRSFKIPFNVDPADRPRLKQVQLWASDDAGFHWKEATHTTPDRPEFIFRATKDGEYWLAVRTLDTQGRLNPGDDAQVEPNMKVIVDSKPPSLVVEPDGRRGSLCSIRWEVHDEHLNPASLVIEYQVDGAKTWGKVRINRPASLIGSAQWDAGTAEPLVVRALVDDMAGNRAETTTDIPEGTASKADLAASDVGAFSEPSPISPISAGPDFTPVDDSPRRRTRERTPEPEPEAFPPPASDEKSGGNEPDPFLGPGGSDPPPAAAAGSNVQAPARSQSLLVGNPQFPLQYAVDDAGPDGPNTVELWVTSDGGRTWNRRGEDPDRTSPFTVDLGGEGTFGLYLVARSASGLGDQPPAPGDPPQIWVEVDNTAPSVVLSPPKVGSGKNAGKVAILWRATDFHLAPRPVSLFWRPDQSNAQWQRIADSLPNSGKYIWPVPVDAPPRLHIKIEVTDTVGNRGRDETTESGHVIVDRTRPRSRIIGLDPSVRTGPGPRATPLR